LPQCVRSTSLPAVKILGWQTWSIGAARIDVVATLLLAAIVGLAGTASAGPSCSWDGTASPASLEGGSDAQGSSAPIRFWLSTDGSTTADGWYIDDVRIVNIVNDAVEGALGASLTESGSVMLRWTIGTLAGVEGLNIYRSTSPDGEFIRVNDSPIPPCSPGSFEDATVWPETMSNALTSGMPELIRSAIWRPMS